MLHPSLLLLLLLLLLRLLLLLLLLLLLFDLLLRFAFSSLIAGFSRVTFETDDVRESLTSGGGG